MTTNRKEQAKDFTSFLTNAVSPYHAVGEIVDRLTGEGFKYITDDDLVSNQVPLLPGGKYMTYRNHSAVIAFVIPTQFDPDHGGFTIAAGHTDSPCLRIRPNSSIVSENYIQLGCELYGGGLWHTWFDRELALAGRVIVKTNNTLEERLVNICRPILLIPNLAIHLQTADERAAFKVEKEEHMRPISCFKPSDDAAKMIPDSWLKSGEEGEPPFITRILAEELGVEPHVIVDLDISLYDAHVPTSWGFYDEFIASGRLDNQLSNYANLCALQEVNLPYIRDICVAVSFDHEEIGSQSWVGADSGLLDSWLHSIWRNVKADVSLQSKGGQFSDYTCALRRSILISTDGAHGVNPNYASKHQAQHKVKCGDGVVIKSNENQRYTTNGITRGFAREVCRGSDVKIQNFVVKNTSPCGSTIGPYVASKLSMKAIDVGAPQWAMHSIRESCHIDDVRYLKNFVHCFYGNYRFFASTAKYL